MTERMLASLSFFQRQFLGTVGINLLSLIVMSGLFFTTFVQNHEDNMVEVTQGKATLLGATSASALLFADKYSAVQALAFLEQYATTRYAQIYDANGALFAEYIRPGEEVDFWLTDFEEGLFFANGNVYVSHTITLDNENLGVIVVSESGNASLAQRQRYLAIGSLIFFGSVVLAYMLNWRLQKLLAVPVSRLVEFVRHVAEHKVYHQRLDVLRQDEIGDVVSGVNAMLDTIERHESELYARANYDELTGLPNRHMLGDRLSHSIEIASRRKNSLALLFLDLDRFKVINDSLGHGLGDAVLVAVARILSGLLRQSDSVCRFGGDEFIILLEDIERDESVEYIAGKILAELAKPLHLEGHVLHVSASIGVAQFPHHGGDAATLLRHADMSMYHAKAQAPGQIHYFHRDMETLSKQRLSLEVQVHKALEEREFSLVYQPQINLASGEIVGFEVLVRWLVNGRYVPPTDFLPVLAEAGLMDRFSRWVLEEACMQNSAWQAAGLLPVKVAVNLPATFFNDGRAVADIMSILEKSGLNARWLEIEITEDTFIASTSSAVKSLASLRDKGVTIAIDDFGTGYSCMSYLQNLPVTVLKIDGCFVRGISTKANSGIVRSITTLGKSLDMLVVAECVETEQQAAVLKDIGCDILQGYLYSKPLCVDDAQDYLAKQAVRAQRYGKEQYSNIAFKGG